MHSLYILSLPTFVVYQKVFETFTSFNMGEHVASSSSQTLVCNIKMNAHMGNMTDI